jgi:hypothetical protein
VHEYDTVLKSLLQDPQNSILEHITGTYVLYVGYPPMQMPSELAGPDFLCRYKPKLKDTILTEVKHMPITENIMDHEIIGPAIQKGELIVIRRQIAKRFGPLPTWADDRLATLSTTELEDLSLRLLSVFICVHPWPFFFPSKCINTTPF